MSILPLVGVRILDLTRVLAGPLCTMILGDLGADVLKVERPGKGDDTREWGPPFDERGESAYYLSVNRNKLSLAADLNVATDRDLLTRLISQADVVVENFLPGTLDRFGIDVTRALERSPKLLWCTISGFGADSRRPGYDFVVQAESGWMAVTGDPGGMPMKSGIALADILAGKDAAIAILAALAGQRRGAPIDRRLGVSLATTARAALINVAQNALVSGSEARRWGNAHANLVPYQLFQAQDRGIVVAVGNDQQWVACTRALGLDALGADPDLATNRGRLARRAVVVESLQRRLETKPASHWLRALGDAGVPCGVVKTVLEAIGDASDVSPVTGMPSSVGGRARLNPPALDQHGEVVRRLGWDAFGVTA